MRNIHILLVEDNAGDVRLTQEALTDGKILHTLYAVKDGVQAMDFLRKNPPYTDAFTPDLILLDLNIPRKNGQEVLKEIKQDKALKSIPVIILTTSSSEQDVLKTYANDANCYITKPVDFDQFVNAIKIIDDFWLSVVKIPGKA
ncbi:response regulator [Rhodocytophaga rosea]|uniref:Response regulator n=1 Tax=Rhodocytophaga rosea TaxID=2704465 RepID=A0A6C0GIK3_9BACT|nr:response regulator [Rhodocytophaga rosea]QHT67664.1 response regulator [Rhodocytophaga rosea]